LSIPEKRFSKEIGSQAGPEGVVPPTGTGKIPVILINFSNTATTNTPTQFNTLLFGTGNNSMKDYYGEVSYGAFTVSGGSAGVMGWYAAPNAHDYYGSDVAGTGDDHWPGDLVYSAVSQADATVNFAEYDTDGDCYVDIVAIVHQGTGQEASGVTTDIWSHSWNLYSAQYYGRSNYGEFTTNDACPGHAGQYIKINNYIIQPERAYSTMVTVGVFAHEYGHALGLPDLYDTDYTSEGIGDWSLMAGGSWNYVTVPGDRPAHLDAWSKYKLGWVTPIQVTGTLTNESIQQAATAADVYKLLTGTANPPSGEYFLVENRQKTGFDAGLPGAGLLIWHIDESKTSNTDPCPGGPPCSNHFKVALVQADNLWNLEYNDNRGDTGDPYPGSTNNTSLTACTSPNSNLYSGTASSVSITGISASASTMTATLSTGGHLTCGSGGGYTMNPNATYSYISGSNLISSWSDTMDEGYYDLALPAGFDFQFYKTPVTSVRITTNGYITFGTTATNYANISIPNASSPNAIIAPFWDDLDLPPGGDVYWGITGSAPNRRLVIEWRNVPSWYYWTETYSFEVILYESSNKIMFQYLDVDSGTDHDFGASATVGIENFTGTSGVQFSSNTASLSNGKAIMFIPASTLIGDFDGDGKTDVGVYHSASGLWFIKPSSGAADYYVGYGAPGYDSVLGDFDGDGKTDIAVYHSASGLWFIKPSSGAADYYVGYGGTGYVPVPGEYDGDGKTDVAVYHQASGLWYIKKSSDGSSFNVTYGGSGFNPVLGDYDGDGKTDFAVYHQASGYWYIMKSSDYGSYSVNYGGTGYVPVPGDYDGDGKTDIAVYHSASGLWFIKPSSGAADYSVGYGGAAYAPVPGDYDGDGKTDIAVYHIASGLWFIKPSSGAADYYVSYGGSSYVPVNMDYLHQYIY
jgi:M6 family metalloprotease-like protein